jgi:flagellar biosynthesis protein
MNDKQMKRAAAIKYDQAKNMAPRVVAKGKGRIAEQIIQVARENDVPLHDDPNLANVLEAMELESEIPADLYRAVAEVLVFIYRLNRRNNPLACQWYEQWLCQ